MPERIPPPPATGSTADYIIAKRVELVMGHMAAGISRAQIIEWVQDPKNGWRQPKDDPVSPTNVDRCIRKAKAEFKRLSEPKREHILGIAYHRLGTLYQRSFAIDDYRTCLQVQAETHKLAGLYPSTKTEISGPDGGPIEITDVKDRLLARLNALAAAADSAGEVESQPDD